MHINLAYYAYFFKWLAGNWRSSFAFFRCAKKEGSNKWVADPDTVDDLAVLEILGEQPCTSRRGGALDDQGVPEGEVVETVEVDRPEDEVEAYLDEIHLRHQGNLSAGNLRVDAELARGDHEELLEHLGGDNAAGGGEGVAEDSTGHLSLVTAIEIVGVDQDVGVEEGALPHVRPS